MGVAIKLYSCVGSNHTTLDSIRALQFQCASGSEDVERIEVHGSQVTADHVGWKYEPRGLTAAQLNLAYASPLSCWKATASSISSTRPACTTSAASRRPSASRCTPIRPSPRVARSSRHSVRVQVYLKDGRRLERSADTPRS